MRIGIDFDNTIACYDGVFYTAAVEQGLISADVATDKTSVRNYLREIGREDDWTKLQGYVYGTRMDLVALFPGFWDFLRAAVAADHSVFIISHKTRHPYLGPKHDLHLAAQRFLEERKIVGSSSGQIALEHLFFELELPEKLKRIASQQCDIFIDDLPELLADPSFPPSTRAILFDPENHYEAATCQGRPLERYASWPSIISAVLGTAR